MDIALLPEILIITIIALFIVVIVMVIKEIRVRILKADKKYTEDNIEPLTSFEFVHKIGEFKSNVLLLSDNELNIYKEIKNLLKNKNIHVFIKVRILDLVKPIGNKDVREILNKELNNLLVDFVATDKDTGKILFVVQVINEDLEKEHKLIVKEILNNAEINRIELNNSNYNDKYYLEKELSKLLSL